MAYPVDDLGNLRRVVRHADRPDRPTHCDVVGRIARSAVPVSGSLIRVSGAVWHGALPIDFMPAQAKLEILLGEEEFA